MIKKYKKRILKYICTFACVLVIPCFTAFNAFAYNLSYPQHLVGLKNIYGAFNVNGTYQSAKTHTFNCGDDDVYNRLSLTLNNAEGVRFTMGAAPEETDRYFAFPVNNDLYDYYFAGSLYCTTPTATFNVTDVRFSSGYLYNDVPTDATLIDVSDLSIIDFTGMHVFGDSFYGKFENLDENTSISFIEIDFDKINFSSSNIYFHFCVIYVPKDTSTQDILSDLHTLLESGNDDTSDAVTDFNEVFEEFNQELEDWEAFDDEIIGEFTDANEQYLTELNNFELSASLLSAGNWLSTSMQTVYDGSSDYKMLWLVPLLFGLPILLFVIKKSGGDNE